ncbi:MAG: divergent polysaccharide deacetylase family protein [Nitrospirae bacterium]|nr:divergent polysaccharide deacetylase family protein [Nitrospirota bacterium]
MTGGKPILALGIIIGIAAGAIGALALHRLLEQREDPISDFSYLFDQDEGPQSTELLFEGFQARAETWSARAPKPGWASPPLLRLVVDDVGYNIDAVDVLLSASNQITLAVLPNAPFRSAAVDRATRAGASVLLHMPMEAHDRSKNRERPMLLTSMEDHVLASVLEKSIADLGPIQGVSNHMGSRFTENRRSLSPVMDVIYAHQFYFLDSVTSSRTIAFQAARARGIPAAARDIFLDADHTPDGVRRAWSVAMRIAQIKGDTVAIYHPHPATLHTMAQLLRQSSSQVSYALITPTPH